MVGVPIPESAADFYRAVRRGPIFDTVWKLGVISVALLGAIALVAAFGAIGAAIGAVILAALLEENIRAFVIDIWNRDFERFP